MRKLITTLAALFLLSSPALAKDTLTIEFEYDVPEYRSAPDGYRLYLEGTPVCETVGGEVRKFDCELVTLGYGPHNFTLTAYIGSTESPVSPVYVFTKNLSAPGNFKTMPWE